MAMILAIFGACVLESFSISLNKFSKPDLQKMARVISIPRSAWVETIFLVLKNPFKYAVAGYGVFSCVNGGVIRNMDDCKAAILSDKCNTQ
jgi:hypothetical protein